MSDSQDWRASRDRPAREGRSRDDELPRRESARYDDSGAQGERQPTRGRERMSADYDDDLAPPRRRPKAGGLAGLLGSDELTRRLVYGALGVGGVLALGIGGWSLLGGHQSGIPILGPPPGPVRDHPADPGGMQIMSGDSADTDTTGQGEAHLAPGPEQPQPEALAKQYGQPTSAPTPAPETPAPQKVAPVANEAKDAPAPALEADDDATASPAPAKPVAPAAHDEPSVNKSAPEATKPLPDKVAKAPVAATPEGHFAVQLAALDSDAEAHREWDLLSRQAPDLFSDHAPLIEHTQQNGHNYYRLRIGAFPTAQAARAFCIKAHARTIACTPAQF